MNATEIITVNGLREEVEVQRLDAAGHEHAIESFVWDRLGLDASGEDFDALAVECCVLYRDDYDTGESWFQVVDGQGHGDGTGSWTPAQ